MAFNGSGVPSALASSLSCLYGGYVRLSNAVSSSKNGSAFVGFKYFVSLLFCQATIRMLVSKWHSILMSRISEIVSWSTKKQMLWVYAWRVVAVMANKQPFRYRPDMRFIRKPVGEFGLMPLYCNYPVSPFMRTSSPNPASRIRNFVSGFKCFFHIQNRMFGKLPIFPKSVVMRFAQASSKRWLAAFSAFNLSCSKRHGRIISLEAGGYNFAI